MIGLIMAGGSGKRFWPLSRQQFPKQFLKITSDISMIEMTFNRLLKKIKKNDIFVVTSKDQVRLINENIPSISDENVIIEPVGMNTAPAVALSMKYLAERYNEVVFVGGADYNIRDLTGFIDSLEPAEKASLQGNFVTFGVKPEYPATGYGYVEAGNRVDFGFKVKNFKEKPDEATAAAFLKAGNYYWNSGMFMWKLDTILEAYSKYLPKVYSLIEDIGNIWRAKGYGADIAELYSKMPKIPIDTGIMEQVENRIVIPVDYGWSDVGSWKSLYEISEKDSSGNVLKCDSFNIDSSCNYVNSVKYVALLGVKNLVVVDTKDVLLIADMDKSEKVKDIVAVLEKDVHKKRFV
jgi:mannose-1-phosphate guanylyltransferase